MVTSTILNYRTLDELIDSVRIDLKAYSGEGQIEIQEIIKTVQECNYDLGLNINHTKETILEIEHNRCKLPADFQFMNYALFCHNYRVVTPSIGNGLRQQEVVEYNVSPSPNLTTCPCYTVLSKGAQVDVTYCDGITESVYFPPNDDGSERTTKICAMSFGTPAIIPGGSFSYSTDSFCYNDQNTATFTCEIPEDCTCDTPNPAVNQCAVVNADPWNQNKVYTICNGTIGIKIMQICATECREYEWFSPVYLTPNRQASAFMSPQRNSMNAQNQAMLVKGGFMQFVIPCGRVYVNYQGLMEDDQGNLMVLDHPKINLFYEWKVKETILLNLYINGEPDIERRLQLVQQKAKEYKLDAMTIVNTPDYRVMKETFQIIRNNATERFSAPISRFYGRYSGISFIDQWANGSYAQ